MPSSPATTTSKASPVWMALVWAAGAVGLYLLLDSIRWSSATYDEVEYLRVGARWWRTGDQTAITRMGSPLTFWKLQQGPVLWTLDRLGRRELIDDPIRHQQELLPLVRAGPCGSGWLRSCSALLESTAVWPQGDGDGGLALRTEPQSDRPRWTGHDGAAAPGQHDRYALPLLDLSG